MEPNHYGSEPINGVRRRADLPEAESRLVVESMQMVEVLNLLRDLPRADKVRAVEFLNTALGREEPPTLNPDAEHAVWSPCTTNESAAKLSEFLNDSQRRA